MRTFEQSGKSQKTVSSMIENKKTDIKKPAKGKENKPVKSRWITNNYQAKRKEKHVCLVLTMARSVGRNFLSFSSCIIQRQYF